MLKLLDERGWDHADKAQLLVFMEGVIHLKEDESSREYEEWESALEEAKEAGRMYVSIMERKGIEKGIQLGRTEGFQLGEARGIQLGRTEGFQLGEARGIQLGRTEGFQLGEARGIQLGRTETARNLLRMGLDLTKIAEATGLPMEELQSLKNAGRA